jgi:hypothetical protein
MPTQQLRAGALGTRDEGRRWRWLPLVPDPGPRARPGSGPARRHARNATAPATYRVEKPRRPRLRDFVPAGAARRAQHQGAATAAAAPARSISPLPRKRRMQAGSALSSYTSGLPSPPAHAQEGKLCRPARPPPICIPAAMKSRGESTPNQQNRHPRQQSAACCTNQSRRQWPRSRHRSMLYAGPPHQESTPTHHFPHFLRNSAQRGSMARRPSRWSSGALISARCPAAPCCAGQPPPLSYSWSSGGLMSSSSRARSSTLTPR